MATADQQFCLRWNNHQSTLISVFDTLLENGTLVDCTLAAEGQYLKAHKVVLSACSPYLETLLSQHYEKHPIVILKDVKFSELKSMMDYMYRGEVNISQDQLGTFLKAAESLQIKGLSDNGDDARDVGSTASKRQETARPSVTQTRTPIESKRPAPSGESDASRDGSISPSSLRKRRRTRRPSQGDEPDSHVDTNACDLPNAQSTPLPVSVPNTSIVPTSVQSLPKQIVKQEPTSISTIPETGLKKEIMDPPSEPLLEPKTEYLDYMNNENSIEVEDLTLDDDDELDSSMDASRPGPSHGDMSNQGYTWPMSGDQSGTDEIFMAAQEAVGAAAGQRDSQGFVKSSLKRSRNCQKPVQIKETSPTNPRSSLRNQNKAVNEGSLTETLKTSRGKGTVNLLSRNGKKLGYFFLNKRMYCPQCNDFIHKKGLKMHLKYYCNKQHDETEWKLTGSTALCKKCNRTIDPDSVEFHVRYLCQKRQIRVQCFYCTRIFDDYKGLLVHTNHIHHKKHRYQDLLSILPPAESHFSPQGPVKVVRNFLNNYLNTTDESVSTSDLRLQVRQKTNHECGTCGKVVVGTHAFENHINTRCEACNNYACFFCSFKAEYPYQVLDHMEEEHGKTFNTFDIIQAQLTGIIPVVKHPVEAPEDGEIVFANNQLYEPFVPAAHFADHVIKPENHESFKKKKIDNKVKDLSDNCKPTSSGNSMIQKGVKVDMQRKIKMRSIHIEDNAKYEDIDEETLNTTNDQKTAFMKKIGLGGTKGKVRVFGSKILDQKKRRKALIKSNCKKCNELIHPTENRIHKKYHCGKKPNPQWILKSGKALCLRCKTLQKTDTIDFHVGYVCKKKMFSVQCFYCPKICHNYRSLLGHMFSGHKKIHFYHDLMSILPEADFSTGTQQTSSSSRKLGKSVITHCFTFETPNKRHKNDYTTSAKFPSVVDFYSCFYCSYVNNAAYKVLDHMEEIHKKDHILYELLEAKSAK